MVYPEVEEEEETSLVPYVRRELVPHVEEEEEEPIIEGEFREVWTEEEAREFLEEREKREPIEAIIREAEEYREKGKEPGFWEEVGKLAKTALEERERRKELEEVREEARARKGYPKKRGAIGGLAKAIRVPVAKGTERLYMGKAKKGMYVPTSMRKLTTPGAGVPKGRPPIAAAPELSRLRELSKIGGGPPKTGMGLEKLREAGGQMGGRLGQTMNLRVIGETKTPPGWTKVEALVKAEVEENGDVDTVENVVSKVSFLGFPKGEVEEAIKKLLRRKILKKGKEYKGGPAILEVVGQGGG